MEAEGTLLAIAEISVAIAGFASIVVAIRGTNPSGWSRQDRFWLANVFAASVAALLGALLPSTLHHLHVSEGGVWSASNAVFGVLLVALVYSLIAAAAQLATFLLLSASGH